MAKRNDKKIRLIQAADKLFHTQGVNVSTLANIAQLADVPLGNVYYYFKSKESIIMAVIDYRRNHLKALFAGFDQAVDPKVRLSQFIRHTTNTSNESFASGDSLGSLCQELGKQEGEIGMGASDLMNEIISWVEAQFKAMGKGERSKTLAIHLVAGLQGMTLLGVSLKDNDVLARQGQFLTDWVIAQ